jgi:hypothetical protein
MNYFNKLPGSIRYSSAKEWRLFKHLPFIWLLGTFLICTPVIYDYFVYDVLTNEQQKTVYFCIGLLFTYWFFIGTVAIAFAVIIIMKGPGYVADPYELPKEDAALENKSGTHY